MADLMDIVSRWIVLNHESGDFEVYFSFGEANDQVGEWIMEGTHLENISVYEGSKKEVEEIKRVINEYKIKN